MLLKIKSRKKIAQNYLCHGLLGEFMFSCLFILSTKENNFYDFLIACLHAVAFLEEKILS